MTAVLITPEQLLASEPVRRDGMKTPMRKEGDRTISFTWATGEGDLWRDSAQYAATSPRVPFFAKLEVTHHKKGTGAAHYSATLWQTHGEAGSFTMFDGRNGLRVLTDANGAGRFNLARLQGFAERALKQLQGELANDPKVLAYFKPERV